MLLEEMAINLIKPLISIRAKEASRANFSGLQSNIQESIRSLGVLMEIQHSIELSTPKQGVKRKRCHLCKCCNNKYSNICNDCNNFVCPSHMEKLTTVICKNCILKN